MRKNAKNRTSTTTKAAADEKSVSLLKKSKPVATTTQVKELGGESAKNKMSTSGDLKKKDTKNKAYDKKSRRLISSKGKNSDAAGATRNLRREDSNSARVLS